MCVGDQIGWRVTAPGSHVADGRRTGGAGSVTALPDGTCLAADPDAVAIPGTLRVPEPAGARVVPLGGTDALMAASAPSMAELVAGRGLRPVVVDISEFGRLGGCVTCLSVPVG